VADRYVVRPLAGSQGKDEYELWDTGRNELINVTTYDRASSGAAELNRQASPLYDQTTTAVKPAPSTGDDAGQKSQSSITSSNQQQTVYNDGDIGSTGQKFNRNSPNNELPGSRVYNPLSKLSSYTYSITLYMVNPEALNIFVETGGRSVRQYVSSNGQVEPGFYIVAQSGGINSRTESRALTYSGRAGDGDGFDYYIDDLTFTTLTPAKDHSGTPTNTMDFKFKIVEPTGFSFMTQLSNASNSVNKGSNMVNSSTNTPTFYQQHYLLGMRFYGYDANGEVVTSRAFNASDSQGGFSLDGSTDNSSLFERFFPINVNNISFKVDGKAVTYNFEATGFPLQTAFGEKRGVIKEPFTIQASTVEEALSGTGNTNNKAVNGLFQVLNKQNQNDVEQSRASLAGKYDVEFEPNSPIARARIVTDDPTSRAMAPINRTNQSNIKTSVNSKKVDTSTVSISVSKGESILKVIDNIISQSSFIDDALTVIATTQGEVNGDPNSNPQTLKWYTINPIVKVLGRDDIRQDWAYSITYQIQTYEIPYVKTQFKRVSSKYKGPHKRYEYWYTGKNSEIINYEQQFNALYYTIQPITTNNDESVTSVNAGTTTPIATQGTAPGDPNGPRNNRGGQFNQTVRAALYSVVDQAEAKMKILGDPDFLMQNVVGSPSLQDGIYNKYYGAGYSINPNGSQVFVEINFNNALDYNYGPNNGLLSISNDVQFYARTILEKRGIRGLVYQLIEVNSTFSRGSFTQNLTMFLVDERTLLTPAELAQELGQRDEVAADTLSTNNITPAARPSKTDAGSQAVTAPSRESGVKPTIYNGGSVSGPLIRANQTLNQQDPRRIDVNRPPVSQPNKNNQTVVDDDSSKFDALGNYTGY